MELVTSKKNNLHTDSRRRHSCHLPECRRNSCGI